MIRVDETDPVGEIEPSFPYRDVTVRRGVEFKDHYDIQSEIGRGKFGTVYRCKEKLSGLSLAAKVVNTARKEDRRTVEREVEIMRRLQHPRLIQLYDAIDTGKHIYVILELIEGGELFERVIDDDFVLTERSCAVFMRQICEGMEFVHAQNILHLDMKPENILCLTKEGNRIKIIDFGLARQYDPDKKLQVLFGTPEFVAPEVVNFDQIGFGTDMWSIGVICYVLLSGLSPFMGDTDVETMANVTVAKYDFDDEAFADISEDAKDFIRGLLVKDKEGRSSASECRKHAWLARKDLSSPVVPTKPEVEKTRPQVDVVEIEKRDELDVTKDNLRLFVERWRDHPNSPYLIESVGPHRWDLDCGRSCVRLDESDVELTSLCCQSPSPCESICSSPSEFASSPRENGNFLLSVPSSLVYPFERRASEGTATGHDKQRDPVAQIVLAEEIIKLSEHLRSISTVPSVVRTDDKKGSEQRTPSNANAALTRTNPIDTETTTLIEIDPDESVTTAKKAITWLEKRNGERSKVSRESSIDSCRSSLKHCASVASDDVTERNEITEKLSCIAKQRQLNGTIFTGIRNFDRNTEISGPSFSLKRSMSRTQADGNIGVEKDAPNDRVSSTRETSRTSTFLQKQSSRRRSDSSLRTVETDASRVSSSGMSEREVDLTPPWRQSRAKRRFGETCRDVPRISNLQDLHQNLNLNEPTSTKDLLLQLLEEWDDVTRPSGVGRKSVSVDWCGEESVARRSMNSLAEYFQSEQQKPTVPGISPSTTVHR